jgi:hypothetical protein
MFTRRDVTSIGQMLTTMSMFWCREGAFFLATSKMCKLLKTDNAKAAKNAKTPHLAHNLGTVKWGEALG